LAATLALVQATQPEALLVAGSEAGAILLARHGAAISAHAALHAATLPGGNDEDPVVARIPGMPARLVALHTGDSELERRLAVRYRLPATMTPPVVVVPGLADPTLPAAPLRPWLDVAAGRRAVPVPLPLRAKA
jgi:hypothetical protein